MVVVSTGHAVWQSNPVTTRVLSMRSITQRQRVLLRHLPHHCVKPDTYPNVHTRSLTLESCHVVTPYQTHHNAPGKAIAWPLV